MRKSENKNPDLNDDHHLLGWETGASSGIGFGKTCDSGLITYDGSGHQLTFGKTGSGKAVNAAIPQALTYRGSMVILDPKGEIQEVTRRYREHVLRQKIVCLAPFKETGDGLNPFDLLAAGILEEPSFDFANSIASILAGSGQRSALSRSTSNDDFWMDSGVNLVTGVIGAALEGYLKERNLNAVIDALKNDDVVYNLAVLLDTRKISREFNREIAAFLQLTDVTRSGVLATAQSYLRGMSSPWISRLLGSTTFDLAGFINGTVPTTIYIEIPSDKVVSHSKLVRLIFGSLMTALFSRKFIPKHKTIFQLDEVASLGTFEPLRTMLTLMRGQGVIVSSLWQDFSQIVNNFSDWETILNNHGVIRLLGTSNYRQAVRMADIFGVSPQKLMDLKPNEQVLFIDGQMKISRRLDYLKDSLFHGRFDCNRRYLDPFQSGAPNHERKSESSIQRGS